MDLAGHHPTAADLIRSTAKGLRADSTQVRALITHLQDEPGTLERLLDDSVLSHVSGDIDLRTAQSVDAFVSVLDGIGFLVFTFSLPSGAGRIFTPDSTLTPVDAPTSASSDPTSLPANSSLSQLTTTRPATSVFDGTAIEEFLIELPDLDDRTNADDIRLSFLGAAEATSTLIASLNQPLQFLHAPASPPGLKSQLRSAAGPFLRIGVAIPRFDHSARIELGAALIDLCSRIGCGLWQRERVDPDSNHDYWQRIVPTNSRHGHGLRYGRGTRHAVALTCTGPVRAGATAAALRMLHQADAHLGGITATALDGIGVIHLVTYLDDVVTDAELAGRSADDALSVILGLHHWQREEVLKDYRLMVSTHADRYQGPSRQAVWLTWSTPVSSMAMKATVQTARRALMTTIQRHQRDADNHREQKAIGSQDITPPSIDYLISRTVATDRQRGLMKVVIDFNSLGFLKDDTSNLSEAKLTSFCGEVREQWHQDLVFTLGLQPVETFVAWRESWIDHWTSLHSSTHR